MDRLERTLPCLSVAVLELTSWESAVGYIFLTEEKNRAGLAVRMVVEGRVRVAGTGVSSGTGQSGERS